MRRSHLLGVLVLSCASGCTSQQESEIPVVARGRWIELATEREEPVCAHTVATMDEYVGAVFELLDETPPDDVYVRYEWLERSDTVAGGGAVPEGVTTVGDRQVVRIARLMHEHELVHAVHADAWPRTRPFLQEGLAVLLDSSGAYLSWSWPAELSMDPAFEEGNPRTAYDGFYYEGWFIVGQIVDAHGFDGLRELWHAVPRGATAEEIRATYEALFGRSMDALLFAEDGSDPRKWSCIHPVCNEPPKPWDGEVWRLDGPTGCEDDADAIGPSGEDRVLHQAVVEVPPGTLRVRAEGNVSARLYACGLDCRAGAFPFSDVGPDGETVLRPVSATRYRVEVSADLEELPTADPGRVELWVVR